MNQEIVNEILLFRDERDWKQFHNPKDLAISINLEASELLEQFQWTGTDVDASEKHDAISLELADVLIYCIMMADILNVDISKIIKIKLQQNREKYPVQMAYGNKKKYTELGE